MKLKSLRKNPLFLAAIAASLLSLVGLVIFIPRYTEVQVEKSAIENATILVDHIRTFRAYYNENVLVKIKNNTTMRINYDHKEDNGTLPLPATMVHDLGEELSRNGKYQVKMYSNYPFPNRAKRKLDTFETKSLAYLIVHPDETYVKREQYNGHTVMRVAVPDIFYSDKCVQCHNTRSDSPKKDWKLGDVRGVIEVITPIEDELSTHNDMFGAITIFILFNGSLLGGILFYFRQKELQALNTSLEEKVQERTTELQRINRRLNDYKRGVDASAIISITDLAGVIYYVNDAFITMSGYNREELIGSSHNIIRHPDMPKEVFEDLWATIKQGKIWQGNVKNRAKNGHSYYVFTTIVPIVDEQGDVIEYLAIRYDITELVETRDQAIAAEKAKDDFLSAMSHELRTPLNAIIGFSQVLLLKGGLPESTMSAIEKINLSGNHLLRLVNTILDFSKLKSGKFDFTPTAIPVQQLFEEVHAIVEPLAHDKEITLQVLSDPKAVIFGDYQMIKQSLINIISNGIKFSPNETTLTLAYAYDNETSNHILKVCDEGIGISQEDLEKLFQPFVQVRSSDAVKGSGLGLSIVKRMIEEYHNGRITVQSEEGKGSCFSIILPENP